MKVKIRIFSYFNLERKSDIVSIKMTFAFFQEKELKFVTFTKEKYNLKVLL